MSNWSNVAGKAGAGAAIAGVSMTYYALMRRNIELERQHQLEQDISSSKSNCASPEAKGNRRRSEENIMSSHVLPEDDDVVFNPLGSDLNTTKFKSVSASNSRLIQKTESLVYQNQDGNFVDSMSSLNSPERRCRTKTSANISSENLLSDCDKDNVITKEHNCTTLICSSSKSDRDDHRPIDSSDKRTVKAKVNRPNTGNDRDNIDRISKSPIPLPLPVVRCAELPIVSTSPITVSTGEKQMKESKYKLKPKKIPPSSHSENNDNDRQRLRAVDVDVIEESIGDTLASSILSTNEKESPVPVSKSKLVPFLKKKEDVLMSVTMTTVELKQNAYTPTSTSYLESIQHEQDLPEKLEVEDSILKRKKVFNTCNFANQNPNQDQPTNFLKQRIEKKDMNADEIKMDLIFLNKDQDVLHRDHDTNCKDVAAKTDYSPTSLIKKVPGGDDGCTNVAIITSHPDPKINPKQNFKNVNIVGALSSSPSSSSRKINQEYIPRSSWIAWPFKIFPAKYVQFIIIALLILSWLLCALVSYGIIGTIYYTFGWEVPEMGYTSIISAIFYDQSVGSHCESDSSNVHSCSSQTYNKNYPGNQDNDNTGFWQWHW